MKKLLALLMTLLLVLALPLTVMAEDAGEAEDITIEETEVTTPEETNAPETEGAKTTFGFFPATLSETLPIMGMGMLGIFLVTCVIVLAVLVLSRIGKPDEE